MKLSVKSLSTVLITILLFLTVEVNIVHGFSFGAAGDYANGSNFQATVTQMGAANLDFALAVGDLAYSTVEQSWCTTAKSKINNFLIVSGNHDSGESSAGNINTYVQYCPYTLSSPLTGDYGKQYYFDYPATNPIARFIMIVPGLGGSYIGLDTDYSIGHQGYTFTANAVDDARAKGIKWVIVGMHKNYISVMEKSNELGTDLIPMLVSKKVDLILQGHEHGYERTHQLSCINTGTVTPSCLADTDDNYIQGKGTVIDVVGTGGQGLRSLNTADSEIGWFSKYDNTTNGFGKFTVTDTQLSYSFVRSVGGSLSDSFTITSSTLSPTPSTVLSSPSPTRTPTPIPPTPTKTPTPIPTQTATATPVTSSPTPGCTVSLPTTGATMTLSASIGTSGTYRVWTRLEPQDTTNNAFYLQIDSTCPVVVGDGTAIPASSWTWIDYQNGVTTDKVNALLTAGTHVFKIVEKEGGLRIDKIVLTDDMTCLPTNTGDNCLIIPTVTSPLTSPSSTITVTSTQKKGDFNKDGSVDLLDFNIWRSEFLGVATTKYSDQNNDGVVDLLDFNLWLTAFQTGV